MMKFYGPLKISPQNRPKSGLPNRLQKLLFTPYRIELKQTEDELYKFRHFFLDSPWPILVTDTLSNVVYANPAWEKLTGYKLTQISGEKPTFLNSGKTPPEVFKKIYDHLTHGKNYSTEEVINRRKDGTEFQIHATYFPIKKGNRNFYFVQSFHDITERKKHEETREKYTQLIKYSNDAIFSISTDYKIESVNPAARKLYGYTTKELVGKSPNILMPPGKEKVLLQAFQNSTKKYINFEMEKITKDKRIINISTTISPIYGSNKKLFGYSLIHRDITEMKKIDQMKKTFLSSVAHEIKTPITTLKLMLQIQKRLLLAEKIDLPKINTSLKTIDHEFNRLTQLINDLLDLTRLENGRFTLTEEFFDLKELVNETVTKIRLIYDAKSVITAKINSIYIFADRIRIEQVISNLLINAIKHSHSKEPVELTIEIHPHRVVIAIRDKGSGIDRKHLASIFDQFYQVRQNSDGFGLGLYICKTIIKLHRGKIWVRSKADHGSTFFFSLPLKIQNTKSGDKKILKNN